MIYIRALKRSTVGYRLYLVYKKTYNTIINTLKANVINVQFSIGSTLSVGSITINTPISNIEFYLVQADTPFLLCLVNIDILKDYYNNLKNILVTLTKSVPIIRRFGHPFLLWEELL